MKKNTIIITILSIFLFSSCGKIELPELKKDHKNKSKDKNKAISNEETPDTLTINELINGKYEGYKIIKGYIVGYISGMSIKNSVFNIPTEYDNTNLILADDSNEVNYENVAPIRVEKNYRSQLSLLQNPHYFHKKCEVGGQIEPYFLRSGIKRIEDFTIYIDNQYERNTGTSKNKDTPSISFTLEKLIGR